jgi:hypothetical protein
MSEEDYVPADPHNELALHVVVKGLQVGACLGTFIASPVSCFDKLRREGQLHSRSPSPI